MANLEFTIQILTQNAEAELMAFKNKIKEQSTIPLNLSAKEAETAGRQISATFTNMRAQAQETVNVARNVVASLALAGKSGTAEYKNAQNELKKATKNAEEFDKALQKADPQKLTDKFKGLNSTLLSIGAVAGVSLGINEMVGDLVQLDTATAKIRSLGGAAKEIAPELQKMAIEMSGTLPIAAKDIQAATYDALSAGINASKEDMKAFMDAATKLAVGGAETVGGTVNLLTSVVNAYGASATEAARYSDILFNTVNIGKTTIPELNQSLSQVVPTAASVGIGLDQVGASLAVLTANGIPTAQATTALNMLLSDMIKPTADLSVVMQNAGVSMQSLAKEGMVESLRKISEEMQKTGKVAGQVFSVDASKAFATLTNNIDNFQDAMTFVQNTTGSTQEAFDEMGESVEVQLQEALNQVKAIFLDLAQSILPTISGAIDIFKGAIGGLQWIFKNFGDTIGIVIGGLAAYKIAMMLVSSEGVKAMISGIASMITGLAAQTTATGAATFAMNTLKAAFASNPIGLIIMGATAAIAGIVKLVDWLHKSTQEKIEENKAIEDNLKLQKDNIEAQIKDIKTTYDNVKAKKDLIDEYIKLGQNSARTADEQKRFENIQAQLNKQYPELRLNTQNFGQDLSKLQTLSQQAGNQLSKLSGQLSELDKSLLEANKRLLQTQASNAYSEGLMKLDDNLSKFLVGMSGKWQDYYDKIAKEAHKGFYAKTEEDLTNIQINTSKIFGQLYKEAEGNAEKQKKITEIEQIMITRYFGSLRQLITINKQGMKSTIDEQKQDSKEILNLFDQLEGEVKKYGKEYKILKDEQRREQEKTLKDSINSAFQTKQISEKQKKQLLNEIDLIKKKSITQKKAADERYKQMLEEAEQIQKNQEAEIKQKDIDLQHTLERQGRQKTLQDELNYEKAILQTYIDQLAKLKEFELKPEFKSDKAKKELEKQITELNKQIQDENNKIDELDIKIEIQSKEQFEELRNIKLEDIEWDIQIAIDNGQYGRVIELRQMWLDLQKQKATELQAKIDAEIDPVAKAKLQQDLTKLNKNISDQQKQLKIDIDTTALDKISDLTEYTYQKGLMEAKNIYQQEIILAGDSVTKRLIAEKNYQDAVAKLEQEKLSNSLDINDVLLDSMQSMANAFSNSFNKGAVDPIEQKINELDAQIRKLKENSSNFDNEEKKLNESLKNRQISSKSYIESLKKLDKEKAESNANTNDKELRIRMAMLQSMQSANDRMYKAQSDSLKKLIQDNQLNYESLQKLGEYTAINIISSFSTMLLAGVNIGEAFRKAVLGNLIKLAEEAILTYIPQVYLAAASQLGPILGPIAATAIITASYSALELAKAAINARSGVVDIAGPGTTTSDSIPARLSRGESVITAAATEKNKELLIWLNKTNGDAAEFFKSKNRQDQLIIVNSNNSEMLNVMKKMQRGIDALNREKKTLNAVDVKVKLNPKEMIKQVNYDKRASLSRS